MTMLITRHATNTSSAAADAVAAVAAAAATTNTATKSTKYALCDCASRCTAENVEEADGM